MDENYYLEEREEEIDIKELIKVLLRNKKIIVIFFIIGFLGSVIFSKIYQNQKTVTRTTVSFLYNEIKDGINPDGSRFDINKVNSLKVINKTYEKYLLLSNNQTTLSEFEDYISITPIVPKNITAIIEKKLKDGENYKYVPKDYIFNFKSDLGKEKDKELLDFLINNIIEEYIKETTPISKIDKIDISVLQDKTYLYDDFILMIDNKISEMERDINSDPKKIKFLNTSLGYNYINILRNIGIISSIDLEKFRAQIEILNVSSDLDGDRVTLRNKVLELQREREVLRKKSEVLDQVIKNYKRGESELVFSGDITNSVSETDKNYYSLIKDLVEASTKIGEKEVLVEKYKTRLNNLVSPTTQENSYLIQMLRKIIIRLNKEVDNLTKLNEEYYKIEYGLTVQQTSPAETVYTGKSIILIILVGSFVFLILDIAYVLVKESLKKLN